MSAKLRLRGWLSVMFGVGLFACGGDVGDQSVVRSGNGGAGGTGGMVGMGGMVGVGGKTGGGHPGPIPNCDPPRAPGIELDVTCSSFVPALAPTEVVFVERKVVDGLQAHRFRATDACGFDVVLSLPDLWFEADEAPYEMSTWWVQGSVPLGLLAVILRRSGDLTPLLAVAAAGELVSLNGLLQPLSVSVTGTECGSNGLVYPVLLREGSSLPCEPDGRGQRCQDGEVGYVVAGYLAAPESTDVPAVVGRADMISWVVL